MLSTKVLAQEFLFNCQARNLSPLTIDNYRKQIHKFLDYIVNTFGIEYLEELKTSHVRKYVVALQEQNHKPAYVNDLLKAVKVLCRYAYDEGYTDELITKKVKYIKEPRVLIHTFSNKEIEMMIKYYDGKDYLSIRNKVILMILFDTGVRISELMDMRPEQVQAGYFNIYGKGRKERKTPQGPLVSKWLLKYERAKEIYFSHRRQENYYFLSKNGRRLTEEAVAKMMKKAAAAIGINPNVRVSPHTCRHTFAHQELKNGLDLYSLSRLLGHESVDITQRYLESLRDEEILKSAKKTGVLANL